MIRPKVSLLCSKNAKGEDELTLVIKGEESVKILELSLEGHTDISIGLEDCIYIG